MKILIAVLLLAAGALAKDEAAVTQATTGCGPDKIKYAASHAEDSQHPAGQQQPDKALIYVIEEDLSRGILSITTRVGVDGTWMGANKGDSYFFFSLDPGEHHLCMDWPSGFLHDRQFALHGFTAEAGKVYYFRTRVFVSPKNDPIVDLDPVNRDEGEYLVAASAYSSFRQKK